MPLAGSSALHRGLSLPMRCMASAAIGVVAWGSPQFLIALGVLPLLPALILRVLRRRDAFCIAAAYYGSATRAVPGIIAGFFPQLSWAVCLAIWAAHVVLLSVPWALSRIPHGASPGQALARAAWALLLLTVPPLGLLNWGTPLMAAGLLYPGWQAAGLMLTAVLCCLLVAVHRSAHVVQAGIAAAVVAALVANLTYRTPAPVPGWEGVSLNWGRSPDAWSEAMGARHAALVDLALQRLRAGATVVVMPESIAGSSHRPEAALWRRVAEQAEASGAIVLVGQEHWGVPGTGFRNALVAYGGGLHGEVWVSSQVPMPLGDWKFGLEDGAQTDLMGSDLAFVHGVPVAFSMCYEDFLLWPHRGLLSGRARIMVSAANQWPSSGTSAEAAQDTSRNALARLAGVPLLLAKNR